MALELSIVGEGTRSPSGVKCLRCFLEYSFVRSKVFMTKGGFMAVIKNNFAEMSSAGRFVTTFFPSLTFCFFVIKSLNCAKTDSTIQHNNPAHMA